MKRISIVALLVALSGVLAGCNQGPRIGYIAAVRSDATAKIAEARQDAAIVIPDVPEAPANLNSWEARGLKPQRIM